MPEKQTHSSNRIRETLGRLYENQPPHFREYMRRYQQDPTSRVFAPLAEAYRRMGRLDEAIDVCLEGLKHHPDFTGGRVALARCFLDKRKYTRAREELEIVVGISPDNILAQRLLGDCFFSLKEVEKALRCYKIASVLSPEDVGLQDKIHRMEGQLNRGDFDPEETNVTQANIETAFVQPPDSSTLTLQNVQSTDILPIEAEDSKDDVVVSSLQTSSIEPEAPLSLETDSLVYSNSIDEDDLEVQNRETEEDELRRSKIDAILGFEPEKGDSYKTEVVSNIFSDAVPSNSEITTQTLADLYYTQGQYEKSLRIFEKLQRQRPSTEINQKIQQCRAQLGVDNASLRRQQKIDALKSILNKNSNKR